MAADHGERLPTRKWSWYARSCRWHFVIRLREGFCRQVRRHQCPSVSNAVLRSFRAACSRTGPGAPDVRAGRRDVRGLARTAVHPRAMRADSRYSSFDIWALGLDWTLGFRHSTLPARRRRAGASHLTDGARCERMVYPFASGAGTVIGHLQRLHLEVRRLWR